VLVSCTVEKKSPPAKVIRELRIIKEAGGKGKKKKRKKIREQVEKNKNN